MRLADDAECLPVALTVVRVAAADWRGRLPLQSAADAAAAALARALSQQPQAGDGSKERAFALQSLQPDCAWADVAALLVSLAQLTAPARAPMAAPAIAATATAGALGHAAVPALLQYPLLPVVRLCSILPKPRCLSVNHGIKC